MFVAGDHVLGDRDHFFWRYAGVDADVAQRTVQAVDMFVQAEDGAVERARHVEGAVAGFPASVAVGDDDLALRHDRSVEPGHACVAEHLRSFPVRDAR
jgi:hypothetical protein